MTFNAVTNTVISIDGKGMIEYWSSDTMLATTSPEVDFHYKSDTDLYDLAKVFIVIFNVFFSFLCSI